MSLAVAVVPTVANDGIEADLVSKGTCTSFFMCTVGKRGKGLEVSLAIAPASVALAGADDTDVLLRHESSSFCSPCFW